MKAKHLILCFAPLVATLFLLSCHEEEENTPREKQEFDIHNGEVEGKVVISEDFVPIDWDQPSTKVTSADFESGDYTMNLAASEAKAIEKGSIISVDVDSFIYLVKVTKVKTEGTTVAVETEQASLAEVFAGSTFELVMGSSPDMVDLIDKAYDDYQPEECPEDYEDDDTRAGADRLLPDDNPPEARLHCKEKIYPCEYRYRDEDGNIVKVKMDATRGGAAVMPSFTIGHEINLAFSQEGNPYKGYSFSSGVKGEFSTTLAFGVSFYADIPMEYGDFKDSEDDDEAEFTKKSTFKPTFYFDPQFDWNVSFYSTFEYKFSTPEKEIEAFPLGSVKFMVGPVPVFITNEIGVNALLNGSISGGFDIGMGGHGGPNTPYYAGVAISGDKPKAFSGGGPFTHTFSSPSISLNGGLDIQFNIIPEFRMGLYGLIGPKMAMFPCFDNKLEVGVGALYEAAFATWDFGIDLSAKWRIGIALGTGKLRKLLKRVVPHDIQTEPKSVALSKKTRALTINLLKAPSGISCTNCKDLRVGIDNEVDFSTTWKILGYSKPLAIPVTVVFETNDDEDSLFDLDNPDHYLPKLSVGTDAGNGTCRIGWHPRSEESTLTAIIYDAKGKIGATTDVKPTSAPAFAQAVDLGVSVYWANVNVGATTEFDLGDYVEWADKTGKSTMQWFKDSYGNYKDFDECLERNGGFERDGSISHGRYDYATRQWGGQWQMPSKAQWQELFDKCSWEYDELRRAYKVSGNGNHIYIPMAGYKIGTKGEDHCGETGEYWTSTLDKTTYEYYVVYSDGSKQSVMYDDPNAIMVHPNAYYAFLNPEDKNGKCQKINSAARCFRHTIRPVYVKEKEEE